MVNDSNQQMILFVAEAHSFFSGDEGLFALPVKSPVQISANENETL